MVLLNDQPVNYITFPDGTLKVDIEQNDMCPSRPYVITWRYENDAEFMLVAYLKMHFDDKSKNGKSSVSRLKLHYIPNGRMDRQKTDTEVLTLKHFAKLINSLKFDEVITLDPHSHVSEALFDRLTILRPDKIIDNMLDLIATEEGVEKSDLVLFFPDEGAQKRYQTGEFADYVSFFGNKTRDWRTGKILGLRLETHTDKSLDYLDGKVVMIIDDIISAGGTVYYSVKDLEKYGIKSAYAYCSHLENTMFTQDDNKLREMLEDEKSTLKRIFTTDSLFTKESPLVTVFNL